MGFSLLANTMCVTLLGGALARVGDLSWSNAMCANFVFSLVIYGLVYALTGFLPMGWLAGSSPLLGFCHPTEPHLPGA